jgi:hypothetical protein
VKGSASLSCLRRALGTIKKKQKLLNALRGLERAAGLGIAPTDKSFLVLFFKKELLPSLKALP